MTDNPRIEALRRRVEKDPASIAFAQLAEEYRRAGDYQQAIMICREGLARHPGYLSAQVTLGRALIEVQQFDEARRELEAVVSVAPDNLAAIRALADIHLRLGDGDVAGFHAAFRPTADRPAPVTPPRPPEVTAPVHEPIDPVPVFDPALPALEHWLTAIVADRARAR
jgi:tetratricopeptide (TPR) repeat protein